MAKKQTGASGLRTIVQTIPDEDLSHLDDDTPIRGQVEPDSRDFWDNVTEPRKPYGVELPKNDYVRLATPDCSEACLETRMKEL